MESSKPSLESNNHITEIDRLRELPAGQRWLALYKELWPYFRSVPSAEIAHVAILQKKSERRSQVKRKILAILGLSTSVHRADRKWFRKNIPTKYQRESAVFSQKLSHVDTVRMYLDMADSALREAYRADDSIGRIFGADHGIRALLIPNDGIFWGDAWLPSSEKHHDEFALDSDLYEKLAQAGYGVRLVPAFENEPEYEPWNRLKEKAFLEEVLGDYEERLCAYVFLKNRLDKTQRNTHTRVNEVLGT